MSVHVSAPSKNSYRSNHSEKSRGDVFTECVARQGERADREGKSVQVRLQVDQRHLHTYPHHPILKGKCLE